MKNLLITFKSKNNLYILRNILKNYQIPMQIVNTPRSISIGCNQSGKVDYLYYNIVVGAVRQANLSGLLGIYLISQRGEIIDRIL